MSKLETNTIDTVSGTSTLQVGSTNTTTITLGVSGDTVDVPSGVTFDVTGATVTGLTAGITQADVWRINADQSISATTHTTLASNWERADDATFAYIGGGMSQSSGKFTFPATGIYYITFTLYAFDTGSIHYYATKIMGSTDDGSSYDQLASADNTIANVGGTNYNTSTVSCFFDCNNTSSDKVAFRTYGSEAFGLHGDNNSNTSYATFIRLGDT